MKKVCLVLWFYVLSEDRTSCIYQKSVKRRSYAHFILLLIDCGLCCWCLFSNVEAQKGKDHRWAWQNSLIQASVNPVMAEIYAQWEKSHHARPLMGVKGGLMLTPLALKKGEKGATAFFRRWPQENENLEFTPALSVIFLRRLLTLRTQLR